MLLHVLRRVHQDHVGLVVKEELGHITHDYAGGQTSNYGGLTHTGFNYDYRV